MGRIARAIETAAGVPVAVRSPAALPVRAARRQPGPAPSPAGAGGHGLGKGRPPAAGVYGTSRGTQPTPSEVLDAIARTSGMPAALPDVAPVFPALALTVPAVEAGRDLLHSVLATQPLVVVDADRRVQPGPALPWLEAPDPDRTRFALLADTVDDLMWYSQSVWQVTARYATGYPASFRRADRSRVQWVDLEGWLVDGRPATDTEAADLVVFEMPAPGLLWTARRTISTALKLAAATDRYAAMDVPLLTVRNTGPDLTDDEADQLLANLRTAMQTRSTAFVNAPVELDTYTWNAADLQLVEARKETAADVARHLGVPAHYLNAPADGGSLTYTNLEAEHRNLITLYLARWVACLEQTLSRQVPAGSWVRLDFTELLRADPATRIAAWQAGVGIGAITPQDAARLEPLWPDPTTGTTGG